MSTSEPGRPDPRQSLVDRGLKKASARLRGRKVPAPAEPEPFSLDRWLDPVYGEQLTAIDRSLGAGEGGWELFRELDEDLWALLLTREFSGYPNILAFLPELPDPAIQAQWNGTTGVGLAAQGLDFYRRLRRLNERFGLAPLDRSRVLDFGCGWGRLTRMLARDTGPGMLFGCDPVEEILDECRQTGVPASLARSGFLPDRLPFEESFDLIFSFSVFTHISEAAHEACLTAIHQSLSPGGILVMTVRPPAYLGQNHLLDPAAERLAGEARPTLKGPAYLFEPHPVEDHPQFGGGEMHFGEAIITLPYLRERWAGEFDLLDASLMVGDLYQVVVTMRKR